MAQAAGRLNRVRIADQIVDDLRRQILSGELADGSQLPSERDLAADYGVSVPTVREAVRVLAAMGLLTTRNGSRSIVSASSDVLLLISIASVVQHERMTAADVFGLLAVLNSHAVELAVGRATDAEIDRLRTAASEAGERTDAASGPAALTQFFGTLAEISHNPLLAALCRIITDIQLGLAVQLARDAGDEWGTIPRSLHRARMDIVEAIAARDSRRAVQLMREYHDKAVRRIKASPGAKQVRDADPDLRSVLSSWLGANVGIANGTPAQAKGRASRSARRP
jgi:DNA-binding FadR family transcriptional regulator